MPVRIKIYLIICITIPFYLLSLYLPSLTSAATCNTVDAIIYGYSYSTEGDIQDYGVSGSGCGIAGPGDDVCDALGSGGGGCTAVDIGPGSPYEITVGIQNQGSVADRYQISWTQPAGWSIVMQERLNDGSVVEYSTPVTVPTATPGNPPSYNPGEAPFFTFKVRPPSDFLGSQEVVFDIASVNSGYADSVKVVINSRDVLPPTHVVLSMSNITDTSVRVEWTAPSGDEAFFDDFSDGTLSPWSQLFNGVVEVVDDGGNYVLRKTTNPDPNGGWAPLSQSVGDFEMILYTKRATPTGSLRNRYSITDVSGNGYGLYLNFADGTLYMERRDAWAYAVQWMPSPVSGGLTVGQWYTLRLTKIGQGLTAQAYVGRVDPATPTPAATVSASDGTWSSFSQVNVNGGYDYDTDDVRVNAFDTQPAEYILKYSTRYIVDDGVAPGMGEVSFSNATTVQGLGSPGSPGSQECYTVQVQNILAGNDGIPGTLDDIDRTPNTQFFFGVKARDENYNLSPLSNIVSGLTTMSSYLYNMVSVPKVPNPNTPAAVFGDDVGSQLYLYRWDSRGIGNVQGCYDGVPGQYNPYNVLPACTGISSINEGKGYFLWSPTLNVILDAPSGSTEVCANPSLCICADELGRSFTCYTFPLDEGWNMFGNPFGREVDVNKINVQDPAGSVKSFVNAVATGWIEGAIYTHNGINYTDEACNSVSCNVVLQPWKGYWLWVKGGSGYKMLIPRP